jgi:hypothetical protein
VTALYQIVAVRGTEQLGEIAARNVRVTLRLDEPSVVAFTVNGEHPTARFVSEFDTDVIVYRNGDPLIRATIGTTSDNVAETGYQLEVSAVDYRARLDRRILKSDVTFVGEDDTDIVAALLATAQAETAGALGLTVTSQGSPTARNVTFTAGATVREAIDTIANLDGGFDWLVDGELRVTLGRPVGRDRGRVLDYGGAVSAVSVGSDPARYANVVRVSGADGLTPVVVESLPAGVRRFESQVGLTSVTDQDVLDDAGPAVLATALDDWQTWSLRLRSSASTQRWNGLGDIGLGDVVRVVVAFGRLAVNELQRVRGIRVDVDPDGRETVTLDTRGAARRFGDELVDLSRRVRELERLT